LFRCSDRDVKRKEMIFLRLNRAGERSSFSLQQAFGSLLQPGVHQSLLKPQIELRRLLLYVAVYPTPHHGAEVVEVEELARATGGSLRFAGNQIILTLPRGANAAPQAEQSAPAAALSRPFLSAGIETMREILEWHAALKTGIERGYPLSDVWFDNFRRQIQSSLKQTEAAANTDMDQRALPLLTNEFNTMEALTDK
jgi:hypothetical protein